MLIITDTYRHKSTELKGIVDSIVTEAIDYDNSGTIETLEAKVNALVQLLQGILEELPEAAQAAIINQYGSWRFTATIEDSQ